MQNEELRRDGSQTDNRGRNVLSSNGKPHRSSQVRGENANGAAGNQRQRDNQVVISFNSGTINPTETKEEVAVHTVGKIDKDMYKCITEDIRTDEVIITDERIEHIIQRRGKEFYDTYGDKFGEVIEHPDYIFADKKENTALACKEIEQDGKFINIAVRIAVSSDNPEYKNSIITAVGENQKRFRQRLRNNVPLYKKE